MSSLVIGRGEVGQALVEILECEAYDNYDSDGERRTTLPKGPFDVLHIAIPWSEDFIQVVRGYRSIFDPELIIVYSTVPIGTCENLGVVHSPIEGKHPYLADSIRSSPRWLGSSDPHLLAQAEEFWTDLCFEIHSVPSADATEYLKLRSTARYGINLAFADYEADVARAEGIDYALVAQFDEDYNELYRGLGFEDTQRYVLDDPHGFIGGHCVVSNAEMLNEQYPSKMLREIIRLG